MNSNSASTFTAAFITALAEVAVYAVLVILVISIIEI